MRYVRYTYIHAHVYVYSFIHLWYITRIVAAIGLCMFLEAIISIVS